MTPEERAAERIFNLQSADGPLCGDTMARIIAEEFAPERAMMERIVDRLTHEVDDYKRNIGEIIELIKPTGMLSEVKDDKGNEIPIFTLAVSVKKLTHVVKVRDEAINDLLEHSGSVLCPLKQTTCAACANYPGLSPKCLEARKNAALETAEGKVNDVG